MEIGNGIGDWDLRGYLERKLKLEMGGRNRIEVLRLMYKDRDIGSRNWSLYKVKKGKVWFSKNSRKK